MTNKAKLKKWKRKQAAEMKRLGYKYGPLSWIKFQAQREGERL